MHVLTKALIVSVWFMVLTFPLMVMKVDRINNALVWRWENMAFMGIAAFVLALLWHWSLVRRRKEAGGPSLLHGATAVLRRPKARRIGLGLLALLMLVMPVISSLYQVNIMISAMLYIILGLGLNIVVGLLLALINPAYRAFVTADMQYLHLSLFFAYATLYPDLQVLALFFIPIRIKWLALLDAALFAYEILVYLSYGQFAMALLPIISIFNYLIFFWDDLMDYLNRGRARVQHQRSSQTINFKKAQRELQQRRGYLHKCSVCGVTDRDNPDMEFRYCSKCNGYYCYCANHINNHAHVQ